MPEEEDDENLFFYSTQMQVRHEQFEEAESLQTKKASMMNRLQKFQNGDNKVKNSNKIKHSIVKKKGPKREKSRRIELINDFVRANLGSKDSIQDIRANKKDRMKQAMILRYFSGDNKKVSDIMKRVKDGEEGNDRLQNNKNDKANKLDFEYVKNQFTEEEWIGALKCIKLIFPHLSSKMKKSLKIITKSMKKFEEIYESNSASTLLPLWLEASGSPDDTLTEEDLRWLYDLNDDQMGDEHSTFINPSDSEDAPQFVTTLSQAMKASQESVKDTPIDQGCDSESEIADSESDIEILEYPPGQFFLTQPHSTQFAESLKFSTQDKPEPNGNHNEITGTQDQPMEVSSHENSKEHFPAASSYNEPETRNKIPDQILSSPILGEEKETPTPQREPGGRAKDVIDRLMESPSPENETPSSMIHQSILPIKRPFNKFTINENSQLNDLPVKANVQIPLSSEIEYESGDDEVYSTARSQMIESSVAKNFQSSQIIEEDEIPTKAVQMSSIMDPANSYKTSRVELRGNFEFPEDNDGIIKVRKVGTKVINLDSDEEVGDSEDELYDEKDISVVEVVMSVEEYQKAIAPSEELENDANISVLQVPSSQDQIDTKPKKRKQSKKTKSIFDEMSIANLRELMRPWNVKSCNSRGKISKFLEDGLKMASLGLSEEESARLESLLTKMISPPSFKQAVFDKLSSITRSNFFWLGKIITFEPILIDSLYKWLETEVFHFAFERSILEEYCNEMAIPCTNAANQ
ncbi:hypothetical protein HYPBUDRAFT_153031 [Hyphopichia burtonii NRRL Y-1933]|uniref:Structure-specific endonuclease subunit SLX4 n=1 Tax=Hyphopichia burtonii NRRL Y-1933 TaxID=984485 RepID=A0A1E4RIK9_9ASCO|nr:hypothetical protein HYPBUDRAFT_153031 [Hyphopichia burtonii NRRL Y-1933]ODV67112.1 hypothetical protein HYPBUDRAFT_153031 [Hyphopichia burtonii NRRL Y-1933]